MHMLRKCFRLIINNDIDKVNDEDNDDNNGNQQE